MKASDLREVLELLVEQAPKLRKAGVSSFEIGDIAIELAPLEHGETVQDGVKAEDDAESDPLKDKWTFGGGKVPGFERDADETTNADLEDEEDFEAQHR